MKIGTLYIYLFFALASNSIAEGASLEDKLRERGHNIDKRGKSSATDTKMILKVEHPLNADIRDDLKKLKKFEKALDAAFKNILLIPKSIKLESEMRYDRIESRFTYEFEDNR